MNRFKTFLLSPLIISVALSCTFLIMVYIDPELAAKVLLVTLGISIIFLTLNIIHKNWKALILNILLLCSFGIGVYEYLDWYTDAMYNGQNTEIQNGDIIFQISKSSQSEAIQIATKSKYSHMGIIYKKGNEYFVFEASKKVKLTPIKSWINQGVNKHFVIKRLINSEEVITPSVLKRMKSEGEKYSGKDYDKYFEWSDSKIYCSELVWKIYKEAANVEIGELKELRDFNLDNKSVKNKLKERYGNNIPLNEKVISPESMYNSDKLITIQEN